MKIGFSGTRQGMTNDQLLQVHMLLGDLRHIGATQVNHGMCVGSDLQFHGMAKALRYFTVGFPGVRADNFQPMDRAQCDCDLVLKEKPFLIRNRDIVQESHVMLVTPKETTEQWKGSGTWATVRVARSFHRPLVIVWPDGTGLVERVPGVTTPEQYRIQCGSHELTKG